MALVYRRWRVRRWVAGTCVFVLVAVIAGFPVYVRPQIDPLQKADAIFVLGGPGVDRYMLGIDLAEHRWAPTIVLSNSHVIDNLFLAQFCSEPHYKYQVNCVIPDPPTTNGEGRLLRRMAAEHRWHTVIVVSYEPHISRARFTLERCFDGDLVMRASKTDLSLMEWAYQYAYQTAGYVRELMSRGC